MLRIRTDEIRIELKIIIAILTTYSLFLFILIFLEIRDLNNDIDNIFITRHQEKTLTPKTEAENYYQSTSKPPLATPVSEAGLILDEGVLFNYEEEFLEEKIVDLAPASISRLPVLMYHYIEEVPANASLSRINLTVSPEIFEIQMKYLYEKGYQPVVFKDFFDHIEGRTEIPEKPIIITFDDGWKNQYQNAFPVLKKYNFKATFFPVVNYVDGASFMSWDELKKLIEGDMEIGSHTMNHPNLSGLSEKHLQYEIQTSKTILEKKLNQPVLTLAYPYCAFDAEVIKAAYEADYLATRACGINGFRVDSIDFNGDKVYNLYAIEVANNISQFKRYFP